MQSASIEQHFKNYLDQLHTDFVAMSEFFLTRDVDSQSVSNQLQSLEIYLSVGKTLLEPLESLVSEISPQLSDLRQLLPNVQQEESYKKARDIAVRLPSMVRAYQLGLEANIQTYQQALDPVTRTPYTAPGKVEFPPRANRKASEPKATEQPAQAPSIEYIAEQSLVRVGGNDVRIAEIENKLMGYLYTNANRVCNHQEIMDNVFGKQVHKSSIALQISSLRKKIEPNPKQPYFIHTVVGEGYMLKI